jgi:hypothetical protein
MKYWINKSNEIKEVSRSEYLEEQRRAGFMMPEDVGSVGFYVYELGIRGWVTER